MLGKPGREQQRPVRESPPAGTLMSQREIKSVCKWHNYRQTVLRLRGEVGQEASQQVLGTQGPYLFSCPPPTLCLPCLVLGIDSFLWFVLTLGKH